MVYSAEQLSRYFQLIGLPPHPAKPASLECLAELVKLQLATVPFENLSLHYSKHHLLSLDTNDLFDKIVGRRRGGYCMENNTFFGAVLRSLGFTLINAGAPG